MHSFNRNRELPDYSALWESRMRAARADGANPYDNMTSAARYDSAEGIRKDGILRAAALQIAPWETVLDIGSGPGTLALPLARRVRAVTAVEPSGAMRELLRRHCSEEKQNNIRVIAKRWEEVSEAEAGEHDVVIASYSLMMPDIVPALEKMEHLARRKIYLYWFSGLATWEKVRMDLAPLAGKKDFVPQPKSDLLYGVLCEMGISPDVRSLSGTSFCYDYPNAEAAIENLRSRVGVTDRAHDALLWNYIQTNYQPVGGGWRFTDRTHYVELSWTPRKGGSER